LSDVDLFRTRCDALLEPGAADAILTLVSDAALFKFAICVGSVARGDVNKGSDVDLYAELAASDVSLSVEGAIALGHRFGGLGIHLVVLPDGRTLEEEQARGSDLAQAWLQDALVIADPHGAFSALRARAARPEPGAP
jgi:predicted nucleotidyltransferase